MTAQCQHPTVTEREGDTWVDTNGKPHTVVHLKCAKSFTERIGQTVRTRVEGDDMPFRMPPVHYGAKP